MNRKQAGTGKACMPFLHWCKAIDIDGDYVEK